MTWLEQQITWMYFTQKVDLYPEKDCFNIANVSSRWIKNQIVDEYNNITKYMDIIDSYQIGGLSNEYIPLCLYPK